MNIELRLDQLRSSMKNTILYVPMFAMCRPFRSLFEGNTTEFADRQTDTRTYGPVCLYYKIDIDIQIYSEV